MIPALDAYLDRLEEWGRNTEDTPEAIAAGQAERNVVRDLRKLTKSLADEWTITTSQAKHIEQMADSSERFAAHPMRIRIDEEFNLVFETHDGAVQIIRAEKLP